MIRVLLVDDQALVRQGFRMIIDSQPDLSVVGEASNGEEALEILRGTPADVILMDVEMPVMDGIEATRRIASSGASDARVIILTTFDTDETVAAAVSAPVAGYLLKTTRPELLIEAIRDVAAGEAAVAPSVARRLLRGAGREPAKWVSELDRLTARELEVLRLMAEGLSNQEIGRRLYLGVSTVKTHINRILRKLSARDRVQAVVMAREAGLSGTAGERLT